MEVAFQDGYQEERAGRAEMKVEGFQADVAARGNSCWKVFAATGEAQVEPPRSALQSRMGRRTVNGAELAEGLTALVHSQKH